MTQRVIELSTSHFSDDKSEYSSAPPSAMLGTSLRDYSFLVIVHIDDWPVYFFDVVWTKDKLVE